MTRIFVVATLAATLSAGAAFAGISPFLGQVDQVAGTYCPTGWLPTDGSLLPIKGNEALFMLLGTTYGGDGATTFALPNIKGQTTTVAGVRFTSCIAVRGVYPSKN